MPEGILSSLKKKFNELGNEKLIELYDVQSLYGEVTNIINTEGSKVSMAFEPEQIDSVQLASEIKSNIDSVNELDIGPTSNYSGETFYNLDDANALYNFDYAVPNTQIDTTIEPSIEESVVEEPVIEEPKSPVLSSDFNFSDIPDESAPEELTDVPTDEQE